LDIRFHKLRFRSWSLKPFSVNVALANGYYVIEDKSMLLRLPHSIWWLCYSTSFEGDPTVWLHPKVWTRDQRRK